MHPYTRQTPPDSPGHVHVSVYLNSDPQSSTAVDAARRLAAEQNAEFTAIYIETPYNRTASEKDRTVLHDAIRYATSAGAKIEILSGTDPLYLITEYCKAKRVDQLVLTRPLASPGPRRFRKPLAVKLMNRLPDVHLITVPGENKMGTPRFSYEKLTANEVLQQSALIILVVTLITMVAFIIDATGADEAVLAPLYLLGVLICSVFSSKWIWPLVAATVSVLTFDFLFATPRMNFGFNQQELALVFALTFITSIIAGAMAMRLHQESQQAQQSSWRTQVLLEATHLLQETKEPAKIVPAICSKIATTMHRDVLFYPYDGISTDTPHLHPAHSMYPITPPEDDIERKALLYAAENNTTAGTNTEHFPEASYLYMPWRLNHDVIGVLALDAHDSSVGSYEYMILDSIIHESEVSLASRLQAKEFERVQREAESNRLRSNILKGISHDLRTPLTSIIGNVTAAEEGNSFLNKEDMGAIWRSIKSDSRLLSSMVENLLTAARLDNGTMPIHTQLEVLSEVIDAGLNYPKLSNETHPLEIDIDSEMLLVNADHNLISQVVTNMILNAIHHTPDGTPISIRAFEKDDMAVVEVADEGNGINDEEKDAIFDLFYTGKKQNVDSDHYLGLGLFLCKAIIDAHGGTIAVRDNTPKGSIFSFTLPLYDLSGLSQDFDEA